MDFVVVALVLLAAAMHALWNALVKGDGDKTVARAAVLFVGAVFGSILVVTRAMPAREAWPWLLGSALTHGAYYACLLGMYRSGDLGHVYPIARGSAPLLVALGAAVFVSEPLRHLELGGAVLVSLGIASLALGGAGPNKSAVAWALATAVTIAVYTVLDGTGARKSGDALGYAGWSFVVQLPGIAVLALVAGRERVRAFVRTTWKRAIGGGALSFGAWAIVLWAMTHVPIGHVAALRETSVIFAAIIGARLLHEPFGGRRVVAAVVVTVGIVVMHLA